MTIQTSLQDIVKIPANELGKFQLILAKSGYSLDEVVDYDDGRSYENWSTGNGIKLILDICPPHPDQSDQIVSEIIDCWLELRAIRNALEAEVETNISVTEHKYSAFDQLIENIHNLEKEMQEDDAMYKLMIKGEVDTVLVSYYTLDEETRQAVLQ